MLARVGWMCSIDFQYELGEALGATDVYPSEENLRENRACIDTDEFCRAKRVYVFDADEYDAYKGVPECQ